MMSSEQFAEILALGREQNGVEFKGPGSRSDKTLQAQVVRAVLGMANRRDGGLVIIGVSEVSTGINPTGVSEADLPSWTYDGLADSIAVYADPSVTFELQTIFLQNNKFVIIRVAEFEEVPVLCKRDCNTGNKTVLREGACYVRSRRKPETTEVRALADMRDLLDLATEKSLRKFLSRARGVGLNTIEMAEMSDEKMFDDQLGELK